MTTRILVLATLVAAACGSVEEDPVDGPIGGPADAAPPTADADPNAPDATPPPDAPPPPPDAVVCTPNAFLACSDASTAQLCNATGDGFVDQSCGAPGCNGTAGRCNDCVPSSTACDGAVVERCDADGLALPDETCTLSCVDAPAPHCAYISPKYLPDICDQLATEPTFTVASSVTLDTSLDSNCTGGIVTQSGPPICVVRAGTIAINAPLTVTGTRALALVADTSLTITSTLDVSANAATSGPGGGFRVSGAQADANIGGGGAGFRQGGASGGSTTTAGGGGAGGPAFDPLAITGLTGGARPAVPSFGIGVSGGGGGGAATFIACRGTVSVSGLIDAGGGGGRPGFDQIIGGPISMLGAGGGGSGGYVVIQGVGVSVTGRLFANGGGGGGGGISDTSGNPGGDAQRSSTAVAGGGSAAGGQGGAGGSGGIGAAGPNSGLAGSGGSPGGGGGGTGRFQVYTPASVGPTINPLDVSPPFEPSLTVMTR